MTLANAAEAAGKPKRVKSKGYKWDGLPVETLLVEVLKAVDLPPADTVGWAIINHAYVYSSTRLTSASSCTRKTA